MLRVKDEKTRRAMEAKDKAAKKKKKPAGSGATTPLTASSPLRSAAGSVGAGKGSEKEAPKDQDPGREGDKSPAKKKSPAHSKSPTRADKQQSPPKNSKSKSPAHSRSPTRKPK